jgi:hypothetical protein
LIGWNHALWLAEHARLNGTRRWTPARLFPARWCNSTSQRIIIISIWQNRFQINSNFHLLRFKIYPDLGVWIIDPTSSCAESSIRCFQILSHPRISRSAATLNENVLLPHFDVFGPRNPQDRYRHLQLKARIFESLFQLSAWIVTPPTWRVLKRVTWKIWNTIWKIAPIIWAKWVNFGVILWIFLHCHI